MKDKLSIPTPTLPDGWRQTGADEFKISPSLVEKIVYGQRINTEVFDFMLNLAENETARREAENKERSKRIAALTK